MIHIIVTMVVKQEKMDDFLDECKRVRPLVLAEEGCLQYEYVRNCDIGLRHQEPPNTYHITLLEKWISQEALDRHSRTPHMKEFAERVADMRERVEIRGGTEAF